MLREAPTVPPGLINKTCAPAQLIGDLQHVHALSVQLVLAAKDPRHVAFVTDNILPHEPGRAAQYGGRAVVVAADRPVVVLADGSGTICGSCASLHAAFVALATTFGLPLPTAAALVSATPAALVGLAGVGTLAPGAFADMVVLAPAPGLAVLATYVRGRRVHPAPAGPPPRQP